MDSGAPRLAGMPIRSEPPRLDVMTDRRRAAGEPAVAAAHTDIRNDAPDRGGV
jgi:hypothetical protein